MGSAVHKLYFQRDAPRCPCCSSTATQESAMHILVRCTSQFASKLRRIHLQQIRHVMSTQWNNEYDESACPYARTLLNLSAPNNKDDNTRHLATTALHGWLNSIRHEHPLYSIFTKGKVLKAASVEYTKIIKNQ